jgi:hypothetical protein
MNTSQIQRIHKVGLSTRFKKGVRHPYPKLRLTGKWLAEWGFPDGIEMHLLKETRPLSASLWLVAGDKVHVIVEPVELLSTRTVAPATDYRPSKVEFTGDALLKAGCGYLGGAMHLRLNLVVPGAVRIERVVVQPVVTVWTGLSFERTQALRKAA